VPALFLVCAVALAIVHLALVNYFAPLRAVFAPRPITGVDYDLHIGQVYQVVEGLRDWGHSWVYDTRLLAGQPEGTILDAGSKGWQLWTFAVHSCGVSLPVAFNTWVLLVMLAPPLCAFAAARSFELTRNASLAAAAMASALWFFDSFTHWVWYIGMVSWALASCLAPLTLGLFYRFLRTRKLRFAVACAASLGAGHLIHPYTFVLLVLPIGALYVREFRALPRSGHAAVAAMAVFTLAVNSYWLIVALEHWHYILDSAYYAQGRISYLLYDFLNVLRVAQDSGVIGVRSGFRLLCLALGIAGLVALHRRKDPRTLPLAVGVLGLNAIAYAGSLLHVLAQIQPYRMIVPSQMLSAIPAAFYLCEVGPDALRELRPATRVVLFVLALLAVQNLASQVLYFMPNALPAVEDLPDGSKSPFTRYGFLTRLDGPDHTTYSVPHDPYVEPGYAQTLEWLETNVAKRSRLLVQGGNLGERLAWATSFEVVGGFVERNILHAYANYFRRYPTEPPTQAVLDAYLHTYSIDYVVAAPQEVFDQSQALRIVADVGNYRVYRTVRPTGRVLVGRGVVSARTNIIDVADTDPDRPLVLSYHFHEALRCTPNCKVERETRTMDSVGLIRVPAPHPRKIRIYNAYER
jgi:hypothetical protein